MAKATKLTRSKDGLILEEEKPREIYPVGSDSESEQEHDKGADAGGSDDDDEPSVCDSADDYEDFNIDDEEGTGSIDEFEDQGSSDEDDDVRERLQQPDGNSDIELDLEEKMEAAYEKFPRKIAAALAPSKTTSKRKKGVYVEEFSGQKHVTANAASAGDAAEWMNTDDLSSDEEDEGGSGNRIGRVPLHWYDDYDHMGYDSHGREIMKSASKKSIGDRLDQVISQSDNAESGKFVVHDALNDRNVELTPRQLELIRRVQAGAYAHPEFDANPDYVDYYSGIHEISGLNSNRTEPKARFLPSEWEKLQVDRMLAKLEKGDINMDYLTGKVRDMNDVQKQGSNKEQAHLLWKGDEEDLLAARKGPQHIAPPKVDPPGHAESYRPPDEYLPTEEDIEQWGEMDVRDRPHGRLVPQKFPNLRSLGAYEHAVTETFERCLDLYLCPRVTKRRLNIDPESLVPKLPKACDLRPFPTAKCIEYKIEYDGKDAPLIRCLSPSPDGQYLASGSSDGVVRLWEVQTSRLLRSWDINMLMVDVGFARGIYDDNSTKPVVALQWNPNKSHHCLVAAVGTCVFIIATGTAGEEDAELTAALLARAHKGGNVTNEKAAKAVEWKALPKATKVERSLSSFDACAGPVAVLRTNEEVNSLRWHPKGDYFVSVCPKAGSAAVLIHQLSKGNSQQPFSKNKGMAQLACFHPNKPFLLVSSQHHIRIYHLVKQAMVKRKSLYCFGCAFEAIMGGINTLLLALCQDWSRAVAGFRRSTSTLPETTC